MERIQTEFVFGKFKTYQVSLDKIAEMTGLNLDTLMQYDPLAGALESIPNEISNENDLIL